MDLLFRTIFQQSPVSTQVFSPDGKTAMVNKAWEDFWGLSPDILEHYNVLKDPQLKQQGILPYIQKGFSGESSHIPAIEYDPNRAVKGAKSAIDRRWVEAAIYPIFDANNNVRWIVLHHFDVTEQKETERKYRTLFENTADAVELLDETGTILYVSESVQRVLGYSTEKLVHTNIFRYIHPEDQKAVRTKLAHLLRKPDEQQSAELQVRHANGRWVWIEATAVNYLRSSYIRAIVANFRDITERRKTTEALLDSEERLRLAIEAGGIGVWDWDIVNNKIKWSDRVYQIHGVDKKSFDGSYAEYAKRVHPDDAPRVQEQIQKALKEGHPYNVEFRICTPSGDIKWVSTKARVVRTNKTPTRMLGATTDITQRKLLERQKDDFVGIVSHELKTPVTSIKAYAQILHRRFLKAGDTNSAELLAKMDLQLGKLTHLIGDLLDVTKIESGKLKLHWERFSILELIHETVEFLQRTSSKHRLKIHTTKGAVILADKERVSQVLTNFITNAIKYSPDAKDVIIEVKTTKEHVTVCVCDFGMGIPKENHTQIFERFYRGSVESYPGLGLGLYISKEIINRLKGQIWVDSEVGKGAQFCFRLPRASKSA